MPVDPNLIGPTTLAVTTAVSAFQGFLPKIADIRQKSPGDDPEFAADVRMGEVAAVTITLGVGVIVSSLTGSNAPALVGFICAAGLVVLYESTLCRHKPLEGKQNG